MDTPTESIRLAFSDGCVLAGDEGDERKLECLNAGDGTVHVGTWYPDADGDQVLRRYAYQSVAVIERLERACRHETVEEIFQLNAHPELYAAVTDARALLTEIASEEEAT